MHKLFAVLVALLLVADAHAAGDHLACFKVRDSLAKARYTADIDGLVLEPGCVVKVPAVMACVPATKTNVTPPPPGGGGTGTPNTFFCYKVKCPKTTLPVLSGSDQFGSRTVTPSATKLMCAPLAGPPTTTTTTTSSTTTTGPCPPPPQLPATGQTTCWDSSGNNIACPGTGQDGEIQAGAPLAYVDNGDGTITDLNTSLTWEKQSDDGSIHDKDNRYTWDEAFAVHVAALNAAVFAGHNDWRVPNVRELASIASYQNLSPAVSPAFNTACTAGCTVLTCSCTASFVSAPAFYWSSTTFPGAPYPAAITDFDVGTVYGTDKSGNNFVRAVRSGS